MICIILNLEREFESQSLLTIALKLCTHFRDKLYLKSWPYILAIYCILLLDSFATSKVRIDV